MSEHHTIPGSTTGRLLVASPLLGDPNFERTVVLMLDHDEAGALGLVLNRPSATEVADPLPDWGPQASDPPVVFVGGPVQPEGVICLARGVVDTETDDFKPLFDRLGTLDISKSPAEAVAAVDQIRVFAGHSGWGPGQLEAELAEGAWFVLDRAADDPFDQDPTDLWSTVLQRSGGSYALVSRYPADPRWN